MSEKIQRWRVTNGYPTFHSNRDGEWCDATDVSVLESRLAEAEKERDRLVAENDRLRRDRADALSVTTREGLTASEWVARTGKAERESKELSARVRELEGAFDFIAHLHRQREFSERTFGPGARTEGVVDHIRKELVEVLEDRTIAEWIDVVILALDGAWRSGASPEQIVEAMVAKQTKNELRSWPDWRMAPSDKAIEHDRAARALKGEG